MKPKKGTSVDTYTEPGKPTQREISEYQQDKIAEKEGYGCEQAKYRIKRFELLYGEGWK